MDFKVSYKGSSNLCPECKRKTLPVCRGGVKFLVCSCGWKQEITKYPKNIIDTKNINIS
jgi:hypothetical protein